MAGVSVTIFAYGATGSGKTFTMMGTGSAGLSDGQSSLGVANARLSSTAPTVRYGAAAKKSSSSKKKKAGNVQDGLTQMILRQLCDEAAKQRAAGDDVSMKISYLEIYNENIYDLLAEKSKRGRKLKACEGDSKSNGAVSVLNLSAFSVQHAESMLQFIRRGNEQRIMSSTAANEFSSRSHAVIQIQYKRTQKLSQVRAVWQPLLPFFLPL